MNNLETIGLLDFRNSLKDLGAMEVADIAYIEDAYDPADLEHIDGDGNFVCFGKGTIVTE